MLRTIQPMGNIPYAAPMPAAAIAALTGIPKTVVAMATALARPRSAAKWALTRPEARQPRRTTTGTAATSVEASGEPRGSYDCGQGMPLRRARCGMDVAYLHPGATYHRPFTLARNHVHEDCRSTHAGRQLRCLHGHHQPSRLPVARDHDGALGAPGSGLVAARGDL